MAAAESEYRGTDVVTARIGFDAQLGETDAECMARDGQLFDFDEAREIVDHPNETWNVAPFVGDIDLPLT